MALGRIGEKEALELLERGEIWELREEADRIRKSLHPGNIVTFVVDRNINYTNICSSMCLFCAFWRSKDKGYVLSREEVFRKIEEAKALGATSILIQGGLNPELGIGYLKGLFKEIKKRFDIHIHGLSPPEIVFLARKEGMGIDEVLDVLVESGLDTIPGGGAEILVDEVRRKISPNKCTAGEWLEVMRRAHKKGIKSSATMMFGHIEEPRHIIEHLLKLRELQDETGGFTAFIPWTFQPKNTRINVEKKGSYYYLKVLALSRIFLDNFRNIQASWVTQGSGVAQIALFFGANDFGSTMIEENVVKAAGASFRMGVEEIRYVIKRAGFTPAKRDVFYNVLKVYS